MGKIILFLMLISANTSIFENVKQETKLQDDEYVIAVYQSAQACVKCYFQPMEIIDEVMKGLKETDKIKILAFVLCRRKKEMKVFKKHYDWKHYMVMDNKNVRRQIGIDLSSAITVFNSSGDIIFNITDKQFDGAKQKLYDLLYKELKK